MGCCGSKNSADEKSRLIQNNYCHRCGAKLYASALFCAQCGTNVPSQEGGGSGGSTGGNRNRTTSGLKRSGTPQKENWKEREARIKAERAERERKDRERLNRVPVEEPAPKIERNPEEEARERARKKEYMKDKSLQGETEEQFRKRQNVERNDAKQEKYGMDKELERKAHEKLSEDADRVGRMMVWIEAVTKTKRMGEFPDCLKSGKMLCLLANAIRPGIISTINERPIPMQERENIQAYLVACERMGCAKLDLFHYADLYEEKYLPAVIQNIYAMAAIASRSRHFSGPKLT